MALESSPQSVFALTPWRLVCGYPNGRKPTHESTCGACGYAAAFVLPAFPFSPPCFSSCTPLLVASAVLPTCCVTYASPADHTFRDAGGVSLKGLAQFSTATLDDSEAPMTRIRVKITKRDPEAVVQRRENYRPAYVSHTSNVVNMWRLWNI